MRAISLVACGRCGKIHKRGQKCPEKKSYRNRNTEMNKFYSSYRWQKIREQVKKDNLYQCKICMLFGETVPNYADDVHHIVPILEDWELRYEYSNLLPVCEHHHYNVIHKENLNSKNKIEKYFQINLEREIEL